jgi:hypothetical protein
MHPTPTAKEPGGTSRAVAWFRRVVQNIRERTLIAGSGIKLDYQADGTIISIKRAGGGNGGEGGAVTRGVILAAQLPDTEYDTVSVTLSGIGNVTVALPYLLRRTPFHAATRNGVAYSYTRSTQRTATVEVDGYSEVQTIIPPYVVGDEIYCELDPVGGTGVDGTTWIDKNFDARAWALESSSS